jgi:hypothetical protein
MQTSFEVLFVLSMFVPAAAVVAGMAVLLGVLFTGRSTAPAAIEAVVACARRG